LAKSTSVLTQSAEDLKKHLVEQAGFIAESAKRFDEGNISEGKRIAVPIRVLVHDTGNSLSLLSQLGKKEVMRFYDTSIDYDPRNLKPMPGLVMIKMSTEGSGWFAPLDELSPPRLRPKVSFSQWWNKIVLPVDRNILLTRKDLVLAVAHKDGGAHVDPQLDKRYAEITRYDSMGWEFYSDGVKQDFRNPVLVSLRQIAHEMIESLKDEYPYLLD
jgi:hypothetical protein